MCTIYTIQLLSVGMKIGSMIVSRSRSIWVYLCVLNVLASGLTLETGQGTMQSFYQSFSSFVTSLKGCESRLTSLPLITRPYWVLIGPSWSFSVLLGPFEYFWDLLFWVFWVLLGPSKNML